MMARVQALSDQLRGYSPADEVEERHQREMIELLGTSDPFSRDGFEPGHFTASCFIVDASGRLLLHHHRRLGRWMQMGGHIEPGETAVEAALREGMEESGLGDLRLAADSILDLDVHAIPSGKGEPDHRHFDVRYLARTSTPEAIRMDEKESMRLAWVDLPRASSLMGIGESARVIAKIEKALCRS